jgi:hypothetical protein
LAQAFIFDNAPPEPKFVGNLKNHLTGDEALLLLLPAETVSVALNFSNDTRPVAIATPDFVLKTAQDDLDQNNKPSGSWQQLKNKKDAML